MRTWRTEWPQWVILAAMFGLAAIMWRVAPNTLPVHWGLSNQADGFGGKLEALLGPPLLALGIYLLLLVLPRLDPGRANYANFTGAYTLIRYAVLVVVAALYVVMLLAGVGGWQFDIGRIVQLIVGGLLLVAGGTMGKLRPNWFVGIRTPWTLSSKRAWTKTHRLGGWLFVGLGVLFIVGALLDAAPLLQAILPVVLALIVLVLVVYSYVQWRNDADRTPPAGTLPGEQR